MVDISLTPHTNAGGHLPSGYDLIIFTMSEGNWVRIITLPQDASNGNVVNIVNTHQAQSVVKTNISENDQEGIILSNEIDILLTYNNGHWIVSGAQVNDYSSTQVGATIPLSPKAFTNYRLVDGDSSKVITFPTQANLNDQIFIISTASEAVMINPESLLYENVIEIHAGDVCVFRYMTGFEKWVPIRYPTRTLTLSNMQIPIPNAHRSLVSLSDDHRFNDIVLPEVAGDRDRIVIQTTASKETNIKSTNVVNPAAMRLNNGDEYEFLYVAEKEGWVLIRSPDTQYNVSDLNNGNVPTLKRPRTIINVSNSNWSRFITLPKAQTKGSRIIIQNTAPMDTTIIYDLSKDNVATGEIVAFQVANTGMWERETVTIDLLLLFSDEAADEIGEPAMRQRLQQGLNLTNEALEDSGANFRFRSLGIRQVTAETDWTTLEQPLEELRENEVVQGWMDELGADGFYYEGMEGGATCSLGWDDAMDIEVMAVGNISCGTTVMRNELGRILSATADDIYEDDDVDEIEDDEEAKSEPYKQIYDALGMIIAGNTLPYYSTPHRYMPITGIPLGIENQIDAVNIMNGTAEMITTYPRRK